jgi:hypothetical protein
MLGVGFRERESAFDFKSVLNDYIRYVDRMEMAANPNREVLVMIYEIFT